MIEDSGVEFSLYPCPSLFRWTQNVKPHFSHWYCDRLNDSRTDRWTGFLWGEVLADNYLQQAYIRLHFEKSICVHCFEFGRYTSKRLISVTNQRGIWSKTLGIKAEQEVTKKGSIKWKQKQLNKIVRSCKYVNFSVPFHEEAHSPWVRCIGSCSKATTLRVPGRMCGWMTDARQETRETVRQNQKRHRLLCHPEHLQQQ